jgi:CRISPR-associated protein Cas5t
MVVILLAEVKVIKLHISAPSGHFRIIHTNDPQRSYPLPPYSTIIGLLANILGNKELINEMLTNNFSLGIISKHDTISIEYTWMRNLNKSFHVNRFILPNNRYHHESREHMGGQVPISVEVLNDVNLYIYVSHPSDIIMNSLLENTKYPERWFSHLHLGSSEIAFSCSSSCLKLKAPAANTPFLYSYITSISPIKPAGATWAPMLKSNSSLMSE